MKAFYTNQAESFSLKVNKIISSVDNCFLYHKDVDDYYHIKNYSKAIENRWDTDWKLKLTDVLGKK